ncbi:hypothetical protein L3X38_012481 [Prunus dulcis]|uniref:Uncharacterized protein n=1 Tax=Prunus dulcis TaxID=3755 RepID=A0AAD4ZG39_PRUDU|nr:hypothetical protein L3X38_012481 [Prunus dulcis]
MTIVFWFRYSGRRVLWCAVCPRDPCTVYVISKAAEDSVKIRLQQNNNNRKSSSSNNNKYPYLSPTFASFLFPKGRAGDFWYRAAARTQIIKEFKVSTKIVYCKGL